MEIVKVGQKSFAVDFVWLLWPPRCVGNRDSNVDFAEDPITGLDIGTYCRSAVDLLWPCLSIVDVELIKELELIVNCEQVAVRVICSDWSVLGWYATEELGFRMDCK